MPVDMSVEDDEEKLHNTANTSAADAGVIVDEDDGLAVPVKRQRKDITETGCNTTATEMDGQKVVT